LLLAKYQQSLDIVEVLTIEASNGEVELLEEVIVAEFRFLNLLLHNQAVNEGESVIGLETLIGYDADGVGQESTIEGAHHYLVV
jgi:hypothetical protein